MPPGIHTMSGKGAASGCGCSRNGAGRASVAVITVLPPGCRTLSKTTVLQCILGHAYDACEEHSGHAGARLGPRPDNVAAGKTAGTAVAPSRSDRTRISPHHQKRLVNNTLAEADLPGTAHGRCDTSQHAVTRTTAMRGSTIGGLRPAEAFPSCGERNY